MASAHPLTLPPEWVVVDRQHAGKRQILLHCGAVACSTLCHNAPRPERPPENTRLGLPDTDLLVAQSILAHREAE
jgi:hypothetical protein